MFDGSTDCWREPLGPRRTKALPVSCLSKVHQPQQDHRRHSSATEERPGNTAEEGESHSIAHCGSTQGTLSCTWICCFIRFLFAIFTEAVPKDIRKPVRGRSQSLAGRTDSHCGRSTRRFEPPFGRGYHQTERDGRVIPNDLRHSMERAFTGGLEKSVHHILSACTRQLFSLCICISVIMMTSFNFPAR